MSENQVYQVIGFPDEYTILINAGKDNSDLSADDEVRVYEPGKDVRDLDGTYLGKYEFVKDILTVKTVTDNYSICQKIEMVKRPSILSSLATTTQPEYTMRKEKINVSKENVSNWQEENKTIQIGDFVTKN